MKKILLFMSILAICLVGVACKSNSQISENTLGGKINEDYEIVFTPTDNFDIEIIKEKNGDLAYSIYSYGGNVDIKINDEIISLKNAIDENKITIEEILNKSEKYRDEGIINGDTYKDGGSQMYQYPTYTIIKYNTIEGIKDVYIGNSEMDINNGIKSK